MEQQGRNNTNAVNYSTCACCSRCAQTDTNKASCTRPLFASWNVLSPLKLIGRQVPVWNAYRNHGNQAFQKNPEEEAFQYCNITSLYTTISSIKNSTSNKYKNHILHSFSSVCQIQCFQTLAQKRLILIWLCFYTSQSEFYHSFKSHFHLTSWFTSVESISVDLLTKNIKSSDASFWSDFGKPLVRPWFLGNLRQKQNENKQILTCLTALWSVSI